MFSWIFSPLQSLLQWLNEKTRTADLEPPLRTPPAYQIMNPPPNPLQVYAPIPRRPGAAYPGAASAEASGPQNTFIGGWVPGGNPLVLRAPQPSFPAVRAQQRWADTATVISIPHSAERPHAATPDEELRGPALA
jgi:hypothetical protein